MVLAPLIAACAPTTLPSHEGIGLGSERGFSVPFRATGDLAQNIGAEFRGLSFRDGWFIKLHGPVLVVGRRL